MHLKLVRSQKSGMMGMGKVKFSLFAQTALTPEEADNVKKYKMGDEVLYNRTKVDTSAIPMMGVMAGFASSIAARAMNLTVTVADLVHGKTIECKDIVEMRAAEEQIKEACSVFKQVLESAAAFGGEEVIEY
jgi:hypothetical protein